jgi:C-terminal processing protease CtpA/Prc
LKNIAFVLLLIVFGSCHFKNDIEDKQYDKKDLKEDLKIFKGIVTDMHAGVYAYNSPKEIDALFDSISNSFNSSLDLRTFYKKVDYIVDRLKCIHTTTFFPSEFYDSISNRAVFFPTQLALVDNKLIVNTDNQNIPLGAEIIKINGFYALDVIKNLKKFRHTDGNSNAIKAGAVNEDFAYDFYLNYGGFKTFDIEYVEDSSNTFKEISFYGEKLNSLYSDESFSPFFEINKDVAFDLQMNDDTRTAIITISTFTFKTTREYNAFIHFLENSFRLIKLSGFKNLIIDCRENGGGFYDATYSALGYLVNEPLQEFDSAFQRFRTLSFKEYISATDTARIIDHDTAYKTFTKKNNHLYKLNDDEISRWYPQDNIFKGNLYVLINGNVASAASTFAAILKDKTNAILVGEETGGSNNSHNSSMLNFVLPNSQLAVAIPLRRYYQPNKKALKDRGVLPNKEIIPTIKDLINDEDKAMMYIFDSLIAK